MKSLILKSFDANRIFNEALKLGLVTLREDAIRDLERARVRERCERDQGTEECTYRVELSTGQGRVPLKFAQTSEDLYSVEAEKMAGRINRFLRDEREQTLEVRTGLHWVTEGVIGGLVFIFIGLVLMFTRALIVNR